MCSDTERLEMLIVLYICLFLLSYNSNQGLGDIETISLYNQSREMYCDLFLGKFDFWVNYSFDSSYIGLHYQSSRILFPSHSSSPHQSIDTRVWIYWHKGVNILALSRRLSMLENNEIKFNSQVAKMATLHLFEPFFEFLKIHIREPATEPESVQLY